MDDIIKSIAERMGYRVVELIINDKHRKISVIIHKPSGVTIEDCARLNDELLADIEFVERTRGEYDIEVSSPGVERVFRHFDEYDIFTGKEVRVYADDENGRSREYTGILKGVDAEKNILLENGYDFYKIPYPRIRKTSLMFEGGL